MLLMLSVDQNQIRKIDLFETINLRCCRSQLFCLQVGKITSTSNNTNINIIEKKKKSICLIYDN